MKDNPSLSPKVIKRYERLYSGAFYERFVLGRWVAVDGLVYGDAAKGKYTCTPPADTFEKYYISCDYGTVNPTSMGLWGLYEGKWYRFDEYYYASRLEGRQLTDEEYYEKLCRLAGNRKIEGIVIDPSAASFAECIRRKGRYRVIPAKNDVVSGIRKVDNSDVALKEPFVISDVAPKDNHILNIDVQVTGEVRQLSLITISTELNESKDYELNIPGFEEIPIPDEEEEGGQSLDTSLEWPSNDKKYDPVELIVSTDENGEQKVELGTPVKLTVKCPRKIKSFVIEVSENFKSIIPMISGGPDFLDLINNQTLIDFFVGPMYLPTGDELRGQTEVEFDLSSLASLVPTIANENGEETIFTLKIKDERDNEFTENIYFKTVII
jgi:hypothetical protein